LFAALLAAAGWSFAAQGFPIVPRLLLGAMFALMFFVYGLLVSYIYGDARRRGMRHVIWTVVAAVVPNGLGIIAYFLLREPLVQPCAACGARAKRGFAFCPRCGAAVAETCAACRRALEPGWSHCAHCGAPVSSPSPSGRPAASSS
jgi:predicted RNA-binding Zn-ribbon protein involved in translation (DUF1610 family)